MLGTLFLCACNNNSPQKDNNIIQTNSTSYIAMDQNLYKNGLLYTDNVYGSDCVCFLDYQTMQGVPICNKPNCTHMNASCVAFQCVGSTTNPFIHFIYNNQLYWFESAYEIVQDDEDSTHTIPKIQSIMHQADLETGTVTDVASIDNLFTDGNQAIRIEDTLYLICSYSLHQMQDGTWRYNSRSQEQYLYAINLESFETQNLGLVNDSPYVENSAIENGNSYGTNFTEVILDGVYDGKVYVHYRYMENKEDMLAYVEAMNEEEVNDADFPWVFEEKYYDPETKELSTCEMPYAVLTCEDCYCYENESDGYTALSPDGSEIQLSSQPYAVVNQRYWMYGGTCYEVENNRTDQLIEKYRNGTMLAYENGKYIIRYFDEDGNTAYDSVSEQNLFVQ